MNRRPDWLAHAHYLLGAARSHFEREYFGEVVVACYYAMFAGAKAIATRQGFETKTHKGLWIDLQNNAGERDLRTYLQMAHQYRHLYHYQMERPSETNAKGQIDATDVLREEVLISFPLDPRCEEGDVPQKCEIDSRYLSVDKPAEDGLPTPPRAESDDRWSALDILKDLKDQP